MKYVHHSSKHHATTKVSHGEGMLKKIPTTVQPGPGTPVSSVDATDLHNLDGAYNMTNHGNAQSAGRK